MGNVADDFKKEIPHIIVFAILVFILLFVVTKFKWVSCNQVPGDWCSVYCQVAGNSRVAFLQGEGGVGDPEELNRIINKNRVFTYAERVPMNELSLGVLKNYELMIVEGAKNITPFQVNAIKGYASQGGSLLWVADSGTRHYLSARDLDDARNRNETQPGYYEAVVKTIGSAKGFGDTISGILQVNFQRMEKGEKITLKIVSKDHAITKGLQSEFEIAAQEIAVVNVNSASSTVLASVYGTKSCTKEKPCPAIIADRYAGPVVYMAFAPELGSSKTLITNLMDFLVTC